MNTTTDALARAVESLGAVEVEPGRYALQPEDGKGEPWYTVSTNALSLCGYVPDSVWLAVRRHLTPMPSWWTPEQRAIWKVREITDDGNLVRTDFRDDNLPQERLPYEVWRERITADLITGEEVTA